LLPWLPWPMTGPASGHPTPIATAPPRRCGSPSATAGSAPPNPGTRLDSALTTRTIGELLPLTADLPAGPGTADVLEIGQHGGRYTRQGRWPVRARIELRTRDAGSPSTSPTRSSPPMPCGSTRTWCTAAAHHHRGGHHDRHRPAPGHLLQSSSSAPPEPPPIPDSASNSPESSCTPKSTRNDPDTAPAALNIQVSFLCRKPPSRRPPASDADHLQ
jgi:hypothetical protein